MKTISGNPQRTHIPPLRGLTSEEAARARREHGTNALTPQKRRSFARRFLSNLGDPVIKILLCALAINLIFMFRRSDWFETAGIAISVFLATLISTLSEYGSEAAFSRLSEESEHLRYRVRRDGTICEIPIEEIVVGDIVLIGAGEKLPADGVMRMGRIDVDQAAMTGENREIRKIPRENGEDGDPNPNLSHWVFRGCAVLGGEGEMEVRAVGDRTFIGEISHEISMETRESPLKIRLARLAGQISRLGYVAAVLVALADLFHAFYAATGGDLSCLPILLSTPSVLFDHLFHALTLGLTVIVVAVPEGLPMMIAVVLSSNIRRMVRDHVLVRKPVGIEAAGSMNILFSDKTGTITEGKLSADEILTADGTVLPSALQLQKLAPALFPLYDATCRYGGAALTDRGEAVGGNATDRALLESVLPCRPSAPATVLDRLPFDSARKYATVTMGGEIGREFGEDGGCTIVRGAPDLLLPALTHAWRADGGRELFYRYRWEDRLQKLTRGGTRVILIATGKPSAGGGFSELTLLCAVTLRDRVRREAKTAVETLHRAGIHVVMITGDHKETAQAIARECGILHDRVDLSLTGEELSRLSDLKIRELLPRLGVVARALPTDKSRLVRIAQEAELVVGMTGDGINDAPALKRADIGFAMGNGTQVAKEAGDIIILDNNLASIVRAVLYGRNIFKSIRKFIVLQLTMNFCAVGVSMICPFMGIDAPVTVVQMLWINIIMDTLGGLAFAGEPPLPSCMAEPPKRRDEPILNFYMIHQIFLLGGFTVGLCLLFLNLPSITVHFREAPDHIYLLTAFFALFIFAGVFNCFNARTDRLNLFAGLSGNPVFLLIMAVISVIQVIFVYLGGAVLRTAPLTPGELGVTMLLALSVFPAELLRKLLYRALHGKGGY